MKELQIALPGTVACELDATGLDACGAQHIARMLPVTAFVGKYQEPGPWNRIKHSRPQRKYAIVGLGEIVEASESDVPARLCREFAHREVDAERVVAPERIGQPP